MHTSESSPFDPMPEATLDGARHEWLARTHSGARPDLLQFVAERTGSWRRELLTALLPLDMEARRSEGASAALEDYQTLWPEASELVADIFQTLQMSPPADGPAVSARRIGEYIVERELGRGGMGVVYLARHLRLGRQVALKVMRAGLLASDDESRRFHAEAETVAKLEHPGIVALYEAGASADRPYLALAYVEGETLGDRLKVRPLAPADAARIIEQVARAVHYAHERGVVHRDLKPQNIMLARDGAPRITDFGLAKWMGGDAAQTASGMILGTPSFMAPEQASGRSSGSATPADVYSLGATLYCCLAGHPPFQAADVWEILRQVREQEPVPLRTLNASLDRDLDTICLKCLRKSPHDRYGSALELAEDLRRYLTGEPIQARRVGRLERGWRWCRRNPVLAALWGSLLVALVAAASVSTWAYWRERTFSGQYQSLAGRESAARSRAVLRLYQSQIARGVGALDHDDFRGARAALDDTSPLDVRGWEYRHLLRRLAGTPLRLEGLPHLITGLAVAGDGRWFATGAISGEVDLWDANTGDRVRQFEIPGAPVVTLAFHPARRELLGINLAGEARVWELDADQPRLSWSTEERGPVVAAFSGDRRRLATAAGNVVSLWDCQTGERSHRFTDDDIPVSCLAFSPDGTTLACGGAVDGLPFQLHLRRLDAGENAGKAGEDAGQIVRRATGRFVLVQWLGFSPAGDRLASVTGQHVTLWDVGSLAAGRDLEAPAAITDVAWSPDGAELTTASVDGVVRSWNALDGGLVRSLGHHAEPILAVTYDPRGHRLYSSAGKTPQQAGDPYGPGDVRAWRVGRAAVSEEVVLDSRQQDEPANYLNGIAFQAGTTIVATGGWHRQVRLVDVATGIEPAPPIDFGDVITDIQSHPRLPLLVVTGTTRGPHGGLALYDARTGALRGLPGHAGTVFARLSPAGTYLATFGEESSVRLRETESGKVIAELTGHQGQVEGLAFSADGKTLITVAGANDSVREVRRWEVPSGRPLESRGTPAPWSSGRAVAWSGDGELVVTADDEGLLRVWRLADGQLVCALAGHREQIPRCAFSPDGRRLASTSLDQTIRIWDPREGVELLRFSLAPDHAVDFAFSSDGALLACSTQAGLVRCWDTRGVADSLRLRGHAAPITAYGFDAQGRLISRDESERTLLWSLVDGQSEALDEQVDPTPYPSGSPDGRWTVNVAGDEPAALVANRASAAADWRPWEEDQARRAHAEPAWHRADAEAAELRDDWYAAVFHWSVLAQDTADDAARGRLRAAQERLEQSRR